MAAFSGEEQLDLLIKKLFYGKAKGGSSDNYIFSNEVYSSHLAVNPANIWSDASSIPSTPPTNTTSPVQVYTTNPGASQTAPLELTAVSLAQNMPGYSNFRRQWVALDGNDDRLDNWISPAYNTAYAVRVYVGQTGWNGTDSDASTKGIQEISFGGNSAADWFFDYESGVLFWTNEELNEIGDFQESVNFTNNTSLIANGDVVYIQGYRYTGNYGFGSITVNSTQSVDISEQGTSASYPVVFASGAGSAADLYVDTTAGSSTAMSYNPSTNTLTTGAFVSTASFNTDALSVAGASTFNGNVTLGDSNNDTVSFSADVNTDILPSANNTYDLGSSSEVWNNVYATNFTGALTGNADSATALAIGRTFQVDLADTTASTAFDGSTNIADVGVTGILAIANGGTGANTSDSWLNSKITISADGSLNYDGTAAAAVDHDQLFNYVANEHIDWTAASAGTIDVTNVPTAGSVANALTVDGTTLQLSTGTTYNGGTSGLTISAVTGAITNAGTGLVTSGTIYTALQAFQPVDDQLTILAGLSSGQANAIVGLSAGEIGTLDGLTASTTELNTLDGITATTTELNILDGVTASTTELNYVTGVTSSIQTQLDSKQNTITGAATTVVSSNLNNSIVVVSNATGKLASSSVTTTELGYLSGASSNLQTQITANANDINNLGTISTQNSNNVAITGGIINGVVIGGTGAAAGSFTTLASSGQATLNSAVVSNNLTVSGNLTVAGEVFQSNSTEVNFNDTVLRLNVPTNYETSTNSAPAAGTAGIEVFDGNATADVLDAGAKFVYDYSSDNWKASIGGTGINGPSYFDNVKALKFDRTHNVSSSQASQNSGTTTIASTDTVNATAETSIGGVSRNTIEITDYTDDSGTNYAPAEAWENGYPIRHKLGTTSVFVIAIKTHDSDGNVLGEPVPIMVKYDPEGVDTARVWLGKTLDNEKYDIIVIG